MFVDRLVSYDRINRHLLISSPYTQVDIVPVFVSDSTSKHKSGLGISRNMSAHVMAEGSRSDVFMRKIMVVTALPS